MTSSQATKYAGGTRDADFLFQYHPSSSSLLYSSIQTTLTRPQKIPFYLLFKSPVTGHRVRSLDLLSNSKSCTSHSAHHSWCSYPSIPLCRPSTSLAQVCHSLHSYLHPLALLFNHGSPRPGQIAPMDPFHHGIKEYSVLDLTRLGRDGRHGSVKFSISITGITQDTH